MTARENAACICTFEDGPREDCPACGRFPPEPSPARENAETADLTLEVERLRAWVETATGLMQRAEGMRELAGTDVGIRMSKLLCEGPAQASNAVEVERLRGELAETTESFETTENARVAAWQVVNSLKEQLTESEKKCQALTVESEGWARQLAEATDLLERYRRPRHKQDADIDDDTDAFLSRAPAQATDRSPWEELYNEANRKFRAAADRYESAEAKLAAVAEIVRKWWNLRRGRGSEAYKCMHNLHALLAPSQGEGGGDRG
jgi:chromosome segregation ATPase